MLEPSEIARGILARGKAMHESSGAKSHICDCARVGMYRCEAHGEMNRRKEGEKALLAMSVTELCTMHHGLSEYIKQLEDARPSPGAAAVTEETAKAVSRYMRHEANCNQVYSLEYDCSCGMEKARAALLAALTPPPARGGM